MEWAEVVISIKYFVNKRGEMRTATGKPAKMKYDRNGYMETRKTINLRVHQAVMRAFDPLNKDVLVRHLDGDKLNNNFDNLKWGTSKENHADMVRHGRAPTAHHSSECKLKGTQHKNSKISDDDVRTIRLRSKTEALKTIAMDYPISYGTVCRVARGEDWAHVK